MAKTPKARFLENKQAAEWMHNITANRFFTEAADAAMLTLTDKLRRMTVPPDPSSAYHRLLGAQEFLEELRRIGDQPEPTNFTPPNDNLPT